MEKVIQSFKDLYNGENVVNRHLTMLLYMILPAILGAYSSYIDKNTPKYLIFPLILMIMVLLILSIYPLICLGGYSIKFLQEKYNSNTGIPEFASGLFKQGMKVLPLYIVWWIYSLIFGGIIVLLMVAPIVIVTSMSFDLSTVAKIVMGLGWLVWFLLMMAVGFVVYPFISYVFIKYASSDVRRRSLCNPLLIVDFMKKDIKQTVMVTIKFFLAGIVANMGVMIFAVFVSILAYVVTATAGAFATTDTNTIVYHPLMIFVLTMLYGISGLANMYANQIVLFATNANYIEVYKEKMIAQDAEREV